MRATYLQLITAVHTPLWYTAADPDNPGDWVIVLKIHGVCAVGDSLKACEPYCFTEPTFWQLAVESIAQAMYHQLEQMKGKQ